MPLGFERINVKKQPPNVSINFIKPLPGPDYDTAHDFLSRVAAIAQPISRKHYLSVMTVEEFPPNREFWGRNFNNGDCIQLVLKSPSTGAWLPFRFVQMVFMHELAHCKEMNHSRAFWAVRNTYADELRALWAKGYCGEGLWGRGHDLYTGQIATPQLPAGDSEMVAGICGGTYRGRRRKKSQLSYQERKQRRIEKKFGKEGMALGDDEMVRHGLENGRVIKGKPRVAGSKRGRELRAAAALARFAATEEIKAEEVREEEDSDLDSEDDYDATVDDAQEARGADGNRLLDNKGNRLVRTCDDVDRSDPGAARELDELANIKEEPADDGLWQFPAAPLSDTGNAPSNKQDHKTPADLESEDSTTDDEDLDRPFTSATGKSPSSLDKSEQPLNTTLPIKRPPSTSTKMPNPTTSKGNDTVQQDIAEVQQRPGKSTGMRDEEQTSRTSAITHVVETPLDPTIRQCPVCSLENDSHATLCAACSNVMLPHLVSGSWSCTACGHVVYLNAGDSARCGLCSAVKQSL